MASPGHDNRPPAAGGHRWLILFIVATAQLMVVLDATIVNIALPSAQRELGMSEHRPEWVVTAYALAFGSLLLLGGRIADRLSRKQVFIIGLIGFARSSAMGGAAVAPACWWPRARSRARSARSSRPPRPAPSSGPSATRKSAARRSASSAPSRAGALPSA